MESVWHLGYAQQFICCLITDDTVWMTGHHWPSYHHTTSISAVKKIDRWAYYSDEQWKWKDTEGKQRPLRGCMGVCVLLAENTVANMASCTPYLCTILNFLYRQMHRKTIGNWLSSTYLLEFLDLCLFKHGKYVGVGSLCCPFLGLLGCL